MDVPVLPLRIAVVTETYPPEINGVARTIGIMAEALRRRGHFIQLIRPRQGKEDEVASAPGIETLLKPGIPLPKYQELRMGLPAKRALLAAWRERRPDVVQIVTEGPLGSSALSAAKKLGIPAVSEFHTNFHTYSKHYGLGLLQPLVAAYLKRMHSRADRTLVPTAEMKEQLAAAGYRNLSVVGRGIDSEAFNPGFRNANLRRQWKAGADDPVALYVGRLAAEKNLRLFVAAVRAMQSRNPHLRVVMVGDGPEHDALRAAHPDFIFAGMQRGADLAAHYASADIFVFPSQTETFGNVTTEAMASGLAIAAYDYAAAKQYLRDGDNALLAPYGDEDRFVEQAQKLAGDAALRQRLRLAVTQSARNLDWARVIDDLERVFRELSVPPRDFGASGEMRPGHAAL